MTKCRCVGEAVTVCRNT